MSGDYTTQRGGYGHPPPQNDGPIPFGTSGAGGGAEQQDFFATAGFTQNAPPPQQARQQQQQPIMSRRESARSQAGDVGSLFGSG
ncbi:hypothetical protein HK097_005403, partial [Rhizophlyctis rosea]